MKPEIRCNDNLAELRKIPDGSVDLVYIDPPFFTQKNRGDYDDRWKSMDAYLEFMKSRLKEMHRVLSPTGSLYLHVDSNANGYLRVLTDDIFGMENFRRDITWERYSGHNGNTGNTIPDITDTILYYTKGKDFTFNHVREPYDGKTLEQYRFIEPKSGRRFSHASLIKSGDNGPNSLVFDKHKIVNSPAGMRFVWTQETLDERLKENPDAIYWTRNGKPRVKIYLDEREGKLVTNLWTGISSRTKTASEETGYATQKPEKLIERVIRISSNPGDVVLDAFAGSGTTCAVSAKLGRKSICIDNNPKACKIMEARLK